MKNRWNWYNPFFNVVRVSNFLDDELTCLQAGTNAGVAKKIERNDFEASLIRTKYKHEAVYVEIDNNFKCTIARLDIPMDPSDNDSIQLKDKSFLGKEVDLRSQQENDWILAIQQKVARTSEGYSEFHDFKTTIPNLLEVEYRSTYSIQKIELFRTRSLEERLADVDRLTHATPASKAAFKCLLK